MEKTITAQVAHTPIIHNGKHYNVGESLELPENEFIELQYYLQKTGETAPLVGATDEQIQTEAAAIADEMEQAPAEQTPAEQTEMQKTGETATDEQIQAEAAAIADEMEQAQAEQTQAEQTETQTTKTTKTTRAKK